MELLQLFEQKVNALAEVVKKLREENQQLSKENGQLKKKLSAAERDVFEGVEHAELLVSEKEKTKLMLDGLIKHIDQLTEAKEL